MFTPTGPFSRQTWRNIESLPGQALNALGQIGSYLGSPKAAQDYTNLLRGSVPGRVGSIPPSANGKSYRRAELELAEAARAGGGGGGGGNAGYSVTNFRPIGGTPAERAQAAETSRVAQLTAQDPELQRYEAARKLAVAPGATPEQVQSAEDIGMQIWAQKYGKTLAPKVKPGQAGYDVIQRTLYPGGTPVPALPAESEAMLNAIAPANEFGVRPDVTPMPGQLPSFGSATEAMFNAITGGGSLVTPMPQKSLVAVPQEQAQNLADTYKKALLSGLGNDPLGIEGIRRYGQ